jgi:hypothetical protein
VTAGRVVPPLLLLLGTAWAAGPARAEAPAGSENDGCARSYERAQEDRTAGHLVDARAELLVCAQTTCPEFIMTDCRRWLDEVEYAMPTVVFAVREGKRDLEDVLVTRNGKLIANRLDGRAVAVDPGKQRFVFELKGNRQRTVEALIVEGEKSRVIAVELPPADEPALTEYGGARPPPALAPAPPVSVAPLVMAGVGAAGLGTFAGFALAGYRQETSLASRCAPRCTEAEVQSVRRRYLLADIGLGVGVGALAVAGYLYLRDPSREPTPALTLAIQPLPGGTVLTGLSRSF